jgi:hypothetical protein
VERRDPGGDECCVLVVCADKEETPRSSKQEGLCENIICGVNAACDDSTESCVCAEGHEGDPNDLEEGCTPITTEAGDINNISLLQITSTSIQVQFPDISGGNLMYVETRVVGRSDPPWENAIILEGNEIFTLTDLKPGVGYTLRWKTPDRTFPDVQVATPAFDVQKPKVIITAKSHDSVTLAFDDFRPPGYTHGYVASWRRADGGIWKTDAETGDTPSLTISPLHPATHYIAKVSIYEDFTNRVLGRSTEDIKFRTLDGCRHQNVSHSVGRFVVGCDSACECFVNGSVSCSDRCERPLHSRGAFKDDPLCVESFSDDSECCVVVTCSHHGGENSPCQDTQCGPNAECQHAVLQSNDAETICVCQDGYTGDPDSDVGCALASPPDPLAAAGCLVNNTRYSQGADWFDGCDYKCTCSQKLEILCQPRCKLITENVDSRCELKPDPEDSCCQTMVCPTDNNNTDILQPSLPFDGCVFKNVTYKEGERFYDGCDQQCRCMGYGDMVCLARCPPTNPGAGENCYTLPDVTDNCCNVTVCDKPADIDNVPDVLRTENSTFVEDDDENDIFVVTETTTTQAPIVNNSISLEKQPRGVEDSFAVDNSEGKTSLVPICFQ